MRRRAHQGSVFFAPSVFQVFETSCWVHPGGSPPQGRPPGGSPRGGPSPGCAPQGIFPGGLALPKTCGDEGTPPQGIIARGSSRWACPRDNFPKEGHPRGSCRAMPFFEKLFLMSFRACEVDTEVTEVTHHAERTDSEAAPGSYAKFSSLEVVTGT